MKYIGIAALVIVALGVIYLLTMNDMGEMANTTTDEAPALGGISVTEANDLIQANAADSNFIVLDVRTQDEINSGVIAHEDANFDMLDFYHPEFKAQLAQLDKEMTYVVYCRSGNRSGQTLDMMTELGFSNVYDVEGGISAWKDAGLAVEILE
jgi:rhodanese-related sulfurtransferase